MEWALEVFKGMEERRLPGETEAVWNLVRDGEVWTYRVWASPYLPEEVRAFPGCRQVVRMEREVRHKGTGEEGRVTERMPVGVGWRGTAPGGGRRKEARGRRMQRALRDASPGGAREESEER